MLSCSIRFSALECPVQKTICSWWWAYVPGTCRAKNTSIKLPSCIKLAFHFISCRQDVEHRQWSDFWATRHLRLREFGHDDRPICAAQSSLGRFKWTRMMPHFFSPLLQKKIDHFETESNRWRQITGLLFFFWLPLTN